MVGRSGTSSNSFSGECGRRLKADDFIRTDRAPQPRTVIDARLQSKTSNRAADFVVLLCIPPWGGIVAPGYLDGLKDCARYLTPEPRTFILREPTGSARASVVAGAAQKQTSLTVGQASVCFCHSAGNRNGGALNPLPGPNDPRAHVFRSFFFWVGCQMVSTKESWINVGN